jgi:predicted dehydrogenase
MKRLPKVDFGHTPYEVAFGRGDVYGVKPDRKRAGKRPLRVGVVGCGGVAQAKWLPAIRYLQTHSEPVTIAGLIDPDAATLAKVAALHGAPAYADIGDLLDMGAVDLVLVLCPDDLHGAVAGQAIAAGVAALVEKPLSRSLDEARALCALAEERGVLLASVANKRFSPPYALAHALIADGSLKAAPTVFSGKFTLGYPYVDILEAGTIHMLDLALWFMGPVRTVHALGTFAADRLESAIATFSFASGAIGTVVTSAAALSFKPWERVEIIGRNALLVVEDQLELTLYDEETGPAKSWKPAIPNTLMLDESFGGYAGLLENVLDAVRGLGPLGASGRDGAVAVALVAAIHESIARGETVEIGDATVSAKRKRKGQGR